LPKFNTREEAFTTVCESHELPRAEAEVQRGIVFMTPAELVVTVPKALEVEYLFPCESKTFPAWRYPDAVRFEEETFVKVGFMENPIISVPVAETVLTWILVPEAENVSVGCEDVE
jgi:hypothetical protein